MEEVHWAAQHSAPAGDLGGQTGQELGQEGEWEDRRIYDLTTILDRDEIAVLVWAEHRLGVWAGSTETADGTVRGVVAIAGGEGIGVNVDQLAGHADMDDTAGDFTTEATAGGNTDDDLVGRTLQAVGFAPFSDGTTGVGGAGTEGVDEWVGHPTANPVFDVRDTIFTTGVLGHSNIDDAAIHADMIGRHVYAVREI